MGNHNTALFWEYDTRLGRRWNIDPEFKKMPGISPFSTNNSNPILYSDPKGDLAFLAPAAWGLAEWAITGLFFGTVAIIVNHNLQEHPINWTTYPSTYQVQRDVLAKYNPTIAAPSITINLPNLKVPTFNFTKPKIEVLVGAAVLAQAVAGFYQVTYQSINANGKIYIGRTSGYGTPQSIVNKRFIGHHRSDDGFFIWYSNNGSSIN